MENSDGNMVDPRNGYSASTKTFQSLRPVVPLPSENTPLSAAAYSLSLQRTTTATHPTAIIDSETGHRVSYSEFTHLTQNLASYLSTQLKLTKGQTAFILSPNSTSIPILYFSLLSLGVIISPANPVSTAAEISRQIQLSRPVIAFATSDTSHKLPALKHRTILLDSPEFDSMMRSPRNSSYKQAVHVAQSDTAAVLYSSGTTGQVKGVALTHRNLIAITCSYQVDEPRENPSVIMLTAPFFHVIGFFYCVKSVSLSETMVVMKRFDMSKMCRAVQDFKITQIVGAPPVVVAMVKDSTTDGFDLGSLEMVGSGGAPLGKDMIAAFKAKFPDKELFQGYGMTETAGAIFRSTSPEESLRRGSVGKLTGHCQARIVDPESGNALPPGKLGELWIRGPLVMKGYIGNPQATSETLVGDGWLRTGDLCYIDNEGFLFVVDRLKELIKYKGYQVPPAELEQLLQSHPEIVDAAVIPFPDEEAGEVPMACVVKRSESRINESQVMDFVAKQVAPYKKIRRVSFVNSIPKSAAGKILRKDLRKAATLGSLSKM
ncbi:hypothetical protein ACET3Z_002701 [Daucus carota]